MSSGPPACREKPEAAVLITPGPRLETETLAAALRESGFDVNVASGELEAPPPAVSVVLPCLGGAGTPIIASIHKTRLRFPDASIVLIGADRPDSEIVALLEAGARAYTASSTSFEEFVRTIRAVRRGESDCSAEVERLVMKRIAALSR